VDAGTGELTVHLMEEGPARLEEQDA